MVQEPTPGSRVRLRTATQHFEGTFLPQESAVYVLKLDSGYNVGILPEHVQELELLEEPQSASTPSAPLEQSSSLPQLGLIHTGGTIASKVDYTTGAVVADFDPASLLQLFPELSEMVRIESSFLGNMFSDDFRFAHFNAIVREIHALVKKGIRNVVVTSGTDFLHYLSAGLSFLLQGYDVGVLVVGSQRSSDRGSSDAGMNLICAAQFLTTTHFTGVGVCMHASSDDDECLILPGVNARKMHASRRDAFKAINTSALALVSYADKEVCLLRELPSRKVQDSLPENAFQLKEHLRIGLLYSHPNMFAEELLAYKNFDGLIIAGSGLGHLPCTAVKDAKEHTAIYAALQELTAQLPVVMSTQTFFGKVNMNVYAQGRKIQETGVHGNFSAMTPETSYMKLAYLLSQDITDQEQLRTALAANAVGEHDIESFQDYEL